MKTVNTLIAVSLPMLCAVLATAEEITSDQARTAVRAWTTRARDKVFHDVENVTPLVDEESGAKMHVVRLAGGGYVVTASDDRAWPIVAWSDTDDFPSDPDNPLVQILKLDAAAILDELEASPPPAIEANVENADPQSLKPTPDADGAEPEDANGHFRDDPYAEARHEWDALLASSAHPEGFGQEPASAPTEEDISCADSPNTISLLSEIKLSIPKMMRTKWGQTTHDGSSTGFLCYNYFTPTLDDPRVSNGSNSWFDLEETNTTSRVPCGCVATAVAQVMYKWRHPSRFSFSWMKTDPKRKLGDSKLSSVRAREAIGELTYAIGEACNAKWGVKGTGMSISTAVSKMRSQFGYSGGSYLESPGMAGSSTSLSEFNSIVVPNLIAGCPVLLGIKKDLSNNVGHCVVADGLDMAGGKCSLHINYGWNGKSGDGWYLPPSLGAGYKYVLAVGANIMPHDSGAIIAGIVVDGEGVPISRAKVTVGGAVGYTDSKGRYSFVVSSGTYQVTAEKDTIVNTAQATVKYSTESGLKNAFVPICLSATAQTRTSTPTISYAFDSHGQATVTITADTGACVYYTIDGSPPVEDPDDSLMYIGPFKLNGSEFRLVRAKAFKEGCLDSHTAERRIAFPTSSDNGRFSTARCMSSTSGSIMMDNASATRESGEPVHSAMGVSGGASVWASFTAPETGDYTFRASGANPDDDEGSPLDTQLAVYTGTSLQTLNLVAANDDADAAQFDFSSRVAFSAVQGQTYRIAVDTRYGQTGIVQLEWCQGRADVASPAEVTPFYDGEEQTRSIVIRSTADWFVVDCSDWITLVKEQGSDGETLEFITPALPENTYRTGTILVQAGDGDFSTITVTQSGSSWYTDKGEAFDAAATLGKRVFMVCGRDSCPNTTYVRLTACESPIVKSLLMSDYVLWYCDCDNKWDDYADYTDGLGSYSLPLVCIINPEAPREFVARRTGFATAAELAEFISMNAEGSIPSCPQSISVTNDCDAASISIHWHRARRAQSYEVWRGTKWSIDRAQCIGSLLSDLEFIDVSAEPGVLYYYRVRAVNAAGAGPFSMPVAASFKNSVDEPSDSFGRALGAPHLTWTSEGDYPWTVQGTNTYDGLAAQSAFVSPTQSGVISTLKTTVLGPTRMSFRYKTRMYASRFSVFVDDDEFFAHQGGSVYDWTAVEVAIPAGYHEVAFTYAKNGYITGGFNGAYLDDIRFDVLSQMPTLSPATTDAERTATAFVGSLSVSIGVPDGGSAFYTLDGSEPTVDSTPYTGPFTINGSTLVKAVCLQPGHDVSPVVSGLYLERHAVSPGEWTTDIDGAMAAALENGSLIVTLCADCSSCSYSRAFAEISESESFLAWARDNGVYLVTADDSRFPDTDAAYDHFRTLFNASGETGYIYYPALAITSAWAPNTPVCYAVARSGRDIGSVSYDGTVESLETALAALMETKPANQKVWRSCNLNYYPYTTTSNKVTCGAAIGTLTQPTRNGFTFGGWWDTSYSSGGRQYTSSSIAPYEDFTLYARWFANYTVRFNANGGTGSMSNQSFVRGTPQALRANSFKRTGYGFAGWSKSASGNAVLTDGQVVSDLTTTGNGTVNLYAVWLPVAEDGSWVTITTEVPVPYSWLDKYGLCEDFGPETAAVRPSGKMGADGASLSYWHDYVAGTDPTNMNSRFEAQLRFDGDNPVVEWTPDLNEGGSKSERKYTIQGKENLDDPWGPSNSSSRFFRVKVEMP